MPANVHGTENRASHKLTSSPGVLFDLEDTVRAHLEEMCMVREGRGNLSLHAHSRGGYLGLITSLRTSSHHHRP